MLATNVENDERKGTEVSNSRDYVAAFWGDEDECLERRMTLGIRDLGPQWHDTSTIGGILSLDNEAGISQDGDYVLMRERIFWTLLELDGITVVDNEVLKQILTWRRERGSRGSVNDHHRGRFPFELRFGDIPSVPAIIRNRAIDIAVMGSWQEAVFVHQQGLDVLTITKDNIPIVLPRPGYRRHVS